MKNIIKLILTIVPLGVSMASAQGDDEYPYRDANYQVPRTEYGQPDLQSTWNYNPTAPMQRPMAYGNKLFKGDLTEEEIAAAREENGAFFREQMALREKYSKPEDAPGGYDPAVWFDGNSRIDDPRTSLIVYPENGRIPPVQEGVYQDIGVQDLDVPGVRPVRRLGGGIIGMDGPEDRGLSERCIVGFNAGPPLELATPYYNNYLQIFQSRDHVVLLTEIIHKARHVYMDDRPYLDDSLRQWAGDARGYWDGDTLVVVTKNFNDLTFSFGPLGLKAGTSYDKTLTERFTRVSEDVLEYEVTIEDPSTYTDKIVMMMPLVADGNLIYEYACHEGNYAMGNSLRGERRKEQVAAGNIED